MNNQSLDRVRAIFHKYGLSYSEVADGDEVVSSYVSMGIPEFNSALQEVETLINSELQNLRQELASEVEGLKFEPEMDSEGDKYLTDTKDGWNRALTEVLAIIKGGNENGFKSIIKSYTEIC